MERPAASRSRMPVAEMSNPGMRQIRMTPAGRRRSASSSSSRRASMSSATGPSPRQPRPGAPRDHQVCQGGQPLPVVPAVQPAGRVGADDQAHGPVALLPAYTLPGCPPCGSVRSASSSRPSTSSPAHPPPRRAAVVPGSAAQTSGVPRRRGLRRRHQAHLVERRGLAHLDGEAQVADVDRIEGAAQQAQHSVPVSTSGEYERDRYRRGRANASPAAPAVSHAVGCAGRQAASPSAGRNFLRASATCVASVPKGEPICLRCLTGSGRLPGR